MKNIIYTLLILLMANTVLAQTGNEITPPAEDETIVGAIGGTADLSALGGATYTIPIKVPDGINGVQPNLSIVYNSQSGNGLLGWGWNLGGLSAITRVGQTKYHDGNVCGVSYDFHDRYALDGQRLFFEDGARRRGEHGSHGHSLVVALDAYRELSLGGVRKHHDFRQKDVVFYIGQSIGKIFHAPAINR